MERELINIALYYYTRIEKRGLSLEASKALINSFYGRVRRYTANSLLQKTKELTSFWIENDSLVQIFKRYMNYLLRKEKLTLGESFSPFVLVNCWESFHKLMLRRPEVKGNFFPYLLDFFGNLEVEEILNIPDRETFFRELHKRIKFINLHRLYLASHIAYLISPKDFPPLTPATGKYLDVRSEDSYLRFMYYVRSKKMKPLEAYALVHMLVEKTPSKKKGVEYILGIDRERELLIKVSKLWNSEKFYEAHEILEEVWKLMKDKKLKECYQGVIRFALALDHYKNGRIQKARNILKKALPQIERCDLKVKLNIREFALPAREILDKLNSKEVITSYPRMKVI